VGEVTPSGEACNGEDDNCDGQVDEGLGSFSCGIGACKTTVAACASGGNVNACVPPTKPQGDATCDGVDDDCDGAIDEDCPTCVPVATNGNDSSADGTTAKPFLTIQNAIKFAVANGKSTICVAAGAACGSTGTYTSAVNTGIVMANGVSVYGNYQSGGANAWTRCAPGTNTVTVIQPRVPQGVSFSAAVVKPTVLDGFRVDRFNAPTTAAITIDGAKSVTISNVAISNTPSVTNSYAIDMLNGAEALITASNIYAGNGSAESIGIRSIGARPTILSNCASLDAAGRCDDFCGAANPSIRGRFTNSGGTGFSAAVLLRSSPGALIEQSALCGADSDNGAGVRIDGDATGVVVRGSLINAWGGAKDAHGIWAEDCKGAAPWIVDNFYIAGQGDTVSTLVDGIRAVGDCHPVIDSNVTILGGGEGSSTNPHGIYCGTNASGVASKCAVLNNQTISGSAQGFPPISVGVRCEDGGCLRIAGNRLITGNGGVAAYGVWLGKTGTVIENNTVAGGCGQTTTGVYAQDSFARLQNNRIFGAACPASGGANLLNSYGLRVEAGAGANELDVHSNDIDGSGGLVACSSFGIHLGLGPAAPAAGKGIFRNNIVRAGVCLTARHNVFESAAAADPRIFQSNDLDPFGLPTSIYFDEAASALGTAAAVNALGDMLVSGVISADAQYVAYPTDLHISATSPCLGAGTPTGAPKDDMDGDARDPGTPDIGADERLGGSVAGGGERGAAPAPRWGLLPMWSGGGSAPCTPGGALPLHPGQEKRGLPPLLSWQSLIRALCTMRDDLPGHTLHGRPLVHECIKLRARPSLRCNCTNDEAPGARGSAGAHRALVHRGRPLGWAHVTCGASWKRHPLVPRRAPLPSAHPPVPRPRGSGPQRLFPSAIR
jgi:hypothetical protein